MASLNADQLAAIKSTNLELYISLLENKVQSLTNEVQGYTQLLVSSSSSSKTPPDLSKSQNDSLPTSQSGSTAPVYNELYITEVKSEFEQHIRALESQIQRLEGARAQDEIQQQQVLQQAEYECDLLITTNQQLNQLINTLRSYLYKLSFTSSRLLSTMKALEHINNSILQLEQELMHISYRTQTAQQLNQSTQRDQILSTTDSAVVAPESSPNSTPIRNHTNNASNSAEQDVETAQRMNEAQAYYIKKYNDVAEQLRLLHGHKQTTLQTEAQCIEEISHLIMLIVQHQSTGSQLHPLNIGDDLGGQFSPDNVHTLNQSGANQFNPFSPNQNLSSNSSLNSTTTATATTAVPPPTEASQVQPSSLTAMLTTFFTGMFGAQSALQDDKTAALSAIAGKPPATESSSSSSITLIKKSSADEITPDQSRLEFVRRRKSQLSQSQQYQTQRAQSQARREQVLEDQKREIEGYVNSAANSPRHGDTSDFHRGEPESGQTSASNPAAQGGKQTSSLNPSTSSNTHPTSVNCDANPSLNSSTHQSTASSEDTVSSSNGSSSGTEVDFEATLAKILDTVGPTALYSYISPEVANDLYFQHNLEKLRKSGSSMSVEEHNQLMDSTTKVIMDTLNRSFGAVSDDIFDILDILDPEVNEITAIDSVDADADAPGESIATKLGRVNSTSQIPNESLLQPKPVKKKYQQHIEVVPINPLLEIATDDVMSVTESIAGSVDSAIESTTQSHLTPSKKVVKKLQKAKRQLLESTKQTDTRGASAQPIDPSKLLQQSQYHPHIDLDTEFHPEDHTLLRQHLIAKQHANLSSSAFNSNIFSFNSSTHFDPADHSSVTKLKKPRKTSYDDTDISPHDFDTSQTLDTPPTPPSDVELNTSSQERSSSLTAATPEPPKPKKRYDDFVFQAKVNVDNPHLPPPPGVEIPEDILKDINMNSMEFKLHLKMLEQQDMRKKHNHERQLVSTLGGQVIETFLQGQDVYREEFMNNVELLKARYGDGAKELNDHEYLQEIFAEKFRHDLDHQLSQQLRDLLFRVVRSDKCDDAVKEQAVFILERKLALRHDPSGVLHPYAVQSEYEYQSKFADEKAFDEMYRISQQREFRLKKRAAFELKQKHEEGKGVASTLLDFAKHTWSQWK